MLFRSYEVNLSSIGSKFIHETGVQLKAMFDEAADNSPAILIMDEVDGVGSGDRGGIAALIQVIKDSKTPIICICNDR